MYKTSGIVWMPIYTEGTRRGGVAINPEFVQACLAYPLSETEQNELAERLWNRVNFFNKGYMPSNWINFHEDTLLAWWFQHPKDSGKWLDVSKGDLNWKLEKESKWTIDYSYHHATDELDDSYNRWLERAFAVWAQFACRTVYGDIEV